eukprot:5853308-Pleurochrysis_carterae.AAC.1
MHQAQLRPTALLLRDDEIRKDGCRDNKTRVEQTLDSPMLPRRFSRRLLEQHRKNSIALPVCIPSRSDVARGRTVAEPDSALEGRWHRHMQTCARV